MFFYVPLFLSLQYSLAVKCTKFLSLRCHLYSISHVFLYHNKLWRHLHHDYIFFLGVRKKYTLLCCMNSLNLTFGSTQMLFRARTRLGKELITRLSLPWITYTELLKHDKLLNCHERLPCPASINTPFLLPTRASPSWAQDIHVLTAWLKVNYRACIYGTTPLLRECLAQVWSLVMHPLSRPSQTARNNRLTWSIKTRVIIMSLFITHACRSCIVWLESGPCIRALPTLSNVLTLASLNTGICRNMTNRLIIMSGLMRLPRLMFSQAQVNFSFVCALLLKKKT